MKDFSKSQACGCGNSREGDLVFKCPNCGIKFCERCLNRHHDPMSGPPFCILCGYPDINLIGMVREGRMK